MKKRIFLPAILCMAISIFTASCSSDDIESPEAKEKMVTLTVSAGSEDDAAATRAVLSESDAAMSPWKWESGDVILLVSGTGSQKQVSKLSLKTLKRGGLSAEFEGQVPASSVTNGGTYRFFYVGKTTDGSVDRTVDASTGSIDIDLTQQTGELKDLKRNCVLTGTGKVVVSDNKATTEGSITLKNVFAVAHFAVNADNGTAITKVGLRGKGVYASANVDLSTGAVTGVSEVGTEIDPETNIFFPDGKTDIYVTFVPGNVAPSFDGYYAGSYTSVVTATPETRNYDESKSFVYYDKNVAKFSVSATQQVAFTNGNMQYVMPIATYTSAMNPRTLKANTLIRWKKSVPLKIKGTRTVHPGYYRLAPEQWETAIPRNKKANGSYTYETVTVDGKEYISPEKYRFFDLPSWGTIDTPTLISYTFDASSKNPNEYDFGQKLKVGNKVTRVLTSKEWTYLMPQEYAVSLPKTKRVWVSGLTKTAKWARCFIDENNNQKRDGNPKELIGFIIFPDDMTLQQAKNVFTKLGQFGKRSEAWVNATTYDKIKESGAVFLPFSGWRQTGSKILKEWGNHGNYSTSEAYGSSMMHLKLYSDFTQTYLDKTDDPNQGCLSRLVQNY